MYMYVCMYVCMHIYMYLCIYIYIYKYVCKQKLLKEPVSLAEIPERLQLFAAATAVLLHLLAI